MEQDSGDVLFYVSMKPEYYRITYTGHNKQTDTDETEEVVEYDICCTARTDQSSVSVVVVSEYGHVAVIACLPCYPGLNII